MAFRAGSESTPRELSGASAPWVGLSHPVGRFVSDLDGAGDESAEPEAEGRQVIRGGSFNDLWLEARSSMRLPQEMIPSQTTGCRPARSIHPRPPR